MARGIGSAAKAAFRKQAAFITPLAVGAGHGFEYGQERIVVDSSLILDEQITGVAMPGASLQGQQIVQGAVQGIDAQYEQNVVFTMLAMVFGTAGAPATVQTTGKKHTLKLAPDNYGLYGTLVIDKTVAVHEVIGFKPMGFTLTVRANEVVGLEIRGIAYKLDPASAVNTSGTFASVTFPATRLKVPFKDCQFYMNKDTDAQLDVTLPSPDQICISDFSIEVDRSFEAQVTTCGALFTDEPPTNGFVRPKGSMTFPVYETANHPFFRDGVKDKQKYKAILDIQSGVLVGAGPATYAITLYLPLLQFDAGMPNVTGSGKIPFAPSFTCARAVSTPAGMPDVNIAAELINAFATDLLA